MSFEFQQKHKENRPTESIVGFAHTFSIDDKKYDVYKLIHLTEQIQQTDIQLSNFKSEKIEKNMWTDNKGKKFSPNELITAYIKYTTWQEVEKNYPEWSNHIKKIKNVDYNTPVLIYENDIIDGMHRLVKAILDKAESIPAKILDELPEEAIATYK
jgi:hypothetical protein